MTTRRFGLAMAMFFCGCGGRRIDVGSNDTSKTPDSMPDDGVNGGSSGSGTHQDAGGAPPPPIDCTNRGTPPDSGFSSRQAWPSDDVCQGPTQQTALVGSWTGYVENLDLPSGNALHLLISSANESRVCGKVTFGSAPPPPAATDPNVGYPPGLQMLAPGAAIKPYLPIKLADVASSPMTLLEGQVTTGQGTGTRIVFQIAERELWREWCALQTSFADECGLLYTCIPWQPIEEDADGGCELGGSKVAQKTKEDCTKISLCVAPGVSVCSCDADGCAVQPKGDITFDITVDGAATGSVKIGGQLYNLHLTKG